MKITDVSVNVRIAAAVVVPLLILCYFAYNRVADAQSVKAQTAQVVEISFELESISQAIEALQTERSATNGYLGSNGDQLAADMQAARVETDAALNKLNAVADQLQTLNEDAISSRLAQIAEFVGQIDATRQTIDGQAVKNQSVYDHFTLTIAGLINLVNDLGRLTSESNLSGDFVGYMSLLSAIEYAERERAQGASAAAVGVFNEAEFRSFVTVSGNQIGLLEHFVGLQPAQRADTISQQIEAAKSVEYEDMRSNLNQAGAYGGLGGVEVVGWFEASTDRIHALRAISANFLQNLRDHANEIASQKGTELLISIVLAVASLAFSILASVFMAATVSRPLGKMARHMHQLAAGQTDIDVSREHGKDEIGRMGHAIQEFVAEAKARFTKQTEQDAAASAQRRAERAEMMQSLQRSFGDVVDAAIAGDFSKRVEAEFPDAELNSLAGSVNALVETVDRGIGETGQVLSALADTDLTRRVEGEYKGAFARLKSDTNAVADRLTDVVKQLRTTSRGVKTATGEILSGANDLSERTTKQAATIEETSAAMEQLAATVLENTKKAQDASGSADVVSKTAEEGAEVMSRANGAMERITSSSAKISNIIGMIDDIAFQTNLLALNASVEAARAGEAGKGFAVVAVEVRRLAQSAAEASNEVKQLIEQSSDEVTEGSKLVAEAATKLESMLEAARQSNRLMEAIAQESREQASSIEEVNAAVRQMDEMTQHNAALVEQTNAAIEQTEAQASELDRIVEIFKIMDTDDGEFSSESRADRHGDISLNDAKTMSQQKSVRHSGGRALLLDSNAAIDKEWQSF